MSGNQLGMQSKANEMLLDIARKCPQLQHITLSWLADVTTERMKSFIDSVPQLCTLNLMWLVSCSLLLYRLTWIKARVTGEAVVYAAQHCSRLHTIRFEAGLGEHTITDEMLKQVCVGCFASFFLVLIYCQILESAKNLTSLTLHGCRDLTNNSMAQLAKCTSLSTLIITDAAKLNPSSHSLINLTNLTTLDLSRSFVSNEALFLDLLPNTLISLCYSVSSTRT